MDRVIGYELSPILWKKVKGKLSAGRVQSAVLKMIADKEKEINDFVPKEYWTLTLDVEQGKDKIAFEYYGKNGKKQELDSEKAVNTVEKTVKNENLKVSEVKIGTRQKASPLPFTTSTLQRDAATFLNFATKKTMMIAQ